MSIRSHRFPHSSPIVLAVTSLLLLSACSSSSDQSGATAKKETEQEVSAAVLETTDAECAYPVTVTDMAGNQVVVESADSVVITDNRAFALLNNWGVEPTAAPRTLMSTANPWKEQESILDTGSHQEPDFVKVIEADPDLIISGYRYSDHADALKDAAPEAAFVDTTDGSDLSADEYAKQSVRMYGEIFCKQEQAEELIGQFDDAVNAAREAYDPAITVMGLVTSANEIRYSNPYDGRGASVYFSLLDLTPALDVEGSSDHQGDDISLEAIAESNPDFYLVLDRDAALSSNSEEPVTPAIELIEGSASLAGTTGVEDHAIYVMPADYYLTEDIYSYIAVLDGLREAFKAAG